jgi:recombination protein RecA
MNWSTVEKMAKNQLAYTPRTKVEKVAHAINSEYETDVILPGNRIQFQKIPRLPTGVFSLDYETGGGWPRGRLVHIYGPESSGKSLLAYLACKEAQQLCAWCSHPLPACSCGAKDPIATAWIDVEHTDSKDWRRKLRVNDDLFLYVPVEHGEEAVDYVSSLIRRSEIGLIVIDSIAALAPAELIEKSASDDASPGHLARMVTRGTRAWQAGLNQKHKHPVTKKPWENLCTIIAINQLRDEIGGYGAPKPPGGRALRHMSSVSPRLTFGSGDIQMTGEDKQKFATQQTITFMIEKNKTYLPRRQGTFTLDFATATVNNEDQVFDYALRWNVVKRDGSWYEWSNHRVQGKEKFLAQLYESGKYDSLEKAVRSLAERNLEQHYGQTKISSKAGQETGAVLESVPVPDAPRAGKAKGKRAGAGS